MKTSPIRSPRDHRRALAEIEGLMHAKHNTPEGDRLDVLVTLVEAWEAKHYPLDLPDSIAAIEHHMENHGLAPRISFRSSTAATASTRCCRASGR